MRESYTQKWICNQICWSICSSRSNPVTRDNGKPPPPPTAASSAAYSIIRPVGLTSWAYLSSANIIKNNRIKVQKSKHIWQAHSLTRTWWDTVVAVVVVVAQGDTLGYQNWPFWTEPADNRSERERVPKCSKIRTVCKEWGEGKKERDDGQKCTQPLPPICHNSLMIDLTWQSLGLLQSSSSLSPWPNAHTHTRARK